MRIPPDGTITEAKLMQYLLRRQDEGDKSRYLSLGGFRRTNPWALEQAIRDATASAEGVEDHRNRFGTFYAIDTFLKGVNGVDLRVRIVWLHRIDDTYSLVTVVPSPE